MADSQIYKLVLSLVCFIMSIADDCYGICFVIIIDILKVYNNTNKNIY